MPCFLSAQHLRRKELFLMDLYDFPQKGPCLALTGSHEHSSWEMAVSGDGGGDGDLGSIPRTTQNERGKGKLLTRHGQKVNIHGCQPPLQFHLPALLTLQHPPPPNGCHTRLHHRSMLYPLSKMTSLSCFRPSAWQDWLSVILTLHSPTKPAWLQQPKRICIQIDWDLRLHLRSKQQWAVRFCHAGRTHIWKLPAVAGAAGNALCQLRCKMSFCPKQTAVPEKPSSPSHRDWVG